MRKTFARGLAAVTLLGALSGVLGGGSASATPTCRLVGPTYVCLDIGHGVRVDLYSDAVEIHAPVRYGSTKDTGLIIGDGFTTRSSGAFVSCDSTKNKYRLTYVIIGSAKSRKLAIAC